MYQRRPAREHAAAHARSGKLWHADDRSDIRLVGWLMLRIGGVRRVKGGTSGVGPTTSGRGLTGASWIEDSPVRWRVTLIIVILIGGCGTTTEGVDTPGGAIVTERIDLPPPVAAGGGSLADALSRRRSVREYEPMPLDLADISQLLWAAQGITSSAGQRTAPSAGGLCPLEIYVVTGRGRYHYDPYRHQLEVLGEEDVRRELSRAALSQQAVEEAAAVFVLAAVYSRIEQKYGDRAERYVKLEAGHAAQNLLLQAVSLGLGAVPIGAFYDDQVQRVLGLPSDHEPLYLIPVGHPAK